MILIPYTLSLVAIFCLAVAYRPRWETPAFIFSLVGAWVVGVVVL